MNQQGGRENELVVLRCEDRGATFPAEGRQASCPSCGSAAVAPAAEPLL